MVNFIELNPWYFHPPQHLWMSFGSTAVTTTNRLGSQHGNSLKKCPLSDSQPGTDGRCVLFLVVGVFWCQLGQLSLVSHNRRLKSDDDLVSYWLIPPRPLPGPLFNLQPPTGWNPSLPPAIPPSLTLCYCFLCIETPVCYSLWRKRDMETKSGFSTLFTSKYTNYYGDQITHLKVSVWV